MMKSFIINVYDVIAEREREREKCVSQHMFLFISEMYYLSISEMHFLFISEIDFCTILEMYFTAICKFYEKKIEDQSERGGKRSRDSFEEENMENM